MKIPWNHHWCTGWGPSVLSWFINPINLFIKSTLNLPYTSIKFDKHDSYVTYRQWTAIHWGHGMARPPFPARHFGSLIGALTPSPCVAVRLALRRSNLHSLRKADLPWEKSWFSPSESKPGSCHVWSIKNPYKTGDFNFQEIWVQSSKKLRFMMSYPSRKMDSIFQNLCCAWFDLYNHQAPWFVIKRIDLTMNTCGLASDLQSKMIELRSFRSWPTNHGDIAGTGWDTATTWHSGFVQE